MSKGLKALENIKREVGIPYFSNLYDIDMWKEDFATIEKEFKALEIIRKYFYNGGCLFGEMTKEEFDFVKEVLL